MFPRPLIQMMMNSVAKLRNLVINLTRKLGKFRKVLTLGALCCLAILVALGLMQWRDRSFIAGSGNLLRGAVEPAAAIEVSVVSEEPIQPIPLEIELDAARVKLGDRLFHDPILSSDNTISCASCHDLAQGGSDGLPTSIGMSGHQVPLNSPTVFNSGFQFRQFWDGRAATLEEQVDGPVSAVGEMGGVSWQEVIFRLQENPEYVRSFHRIYGGDITADQIRNAIATFERSLYTPNAPFDRYLRGDEEAISAEAQQGYSLFKSYGCVTCHQGVLLGGNMYQTLGVFGDYFADRGTPAIKADLGRYNVTKDENDKHVFKVPTLRNVALTSPYFHDGHAKSLDQAIKLMGKYQLGVDMPQDDVDSIMQFLITLNGEYNGKTL